MFNKSISRSLGSSVIENDITNLINVLNNMTDKKQFAIVCIRGPNGSGKTIAAEQINSNYFDINYYGGSYEALNKDVQKHLRANYGDRSATHVVVVAPFIRLSDLKPFRVMMQQYEAHKFIVHECIPALPTDLQERENYLRNDVNINITVPEAAKRLAQEKQALKEDDEDLTASQNTFLNHLLSSQNSLRNKKSQTGFTNNILEDIQLCAYLMHRSDGKLMEVIWEQLCSFEYITSDAALWR